MLGGQLFFRSRGKKLARFLFFHGCEKSCKGRPGYEATKSAQSVLTSFND